MPSLTPRTIAASIALALTAAAVTIGVTATDDDAPRFGDARPAVVVDADD